MAKLDYRNIEKDAQRCGGQPVVVGTRIRAATILTCYRQGLRVEEIVQQFPTLRPADVHDALAYAYDHLDEIEAALAADDEAAVKAQHRGTDTSSLARHGSSRTKMSTRQSPQHCDSKDWMR